MMICPMCYGMNFGYAVDEDGNGYYYCLDCGVRI